MYLLDEKQGYETKLKFDEILGAQFLARVIVAFIAHKIHIVYMSTIRIL